MKKKISLIFIFLFAVCHSFSQNSDLKYYSDSSNDFSGCEASTFLGNLTNAYISEEDDSEYCDTSLGAVRGRTKGDKPVTVIIDVAFVYRNTDSVTLKEIKERAVEIKDFLKQYIHTKEAADFKNSDYEYQLEKEITDRINDMILSSGKIRDVFFLQKDVIE